MPKLLILIVLVTRLVYGQHENTFLISADSCKASPSSRTLSGFRVQNPTPELKVGIVTSLHGVAGCIVKATSDGKVILRKALELNAVDTSADAALLVSSELPSSDGFQVRKAVNWDQMKGAVLTAWGHPKGITVKDTRVFVHDPSKEELRTYLRAVSPQVRKALQERHSPEVAMNVLSLEGLLQEGDSGAPILDAKGFVVAVANGGLDNGFGGVVWGVPWDSIHWDPVDMNQDLKRLETLSVVGLFSFAPVLDKIRLPPDVTNENSMHAAENGDLAGIQSMMESGNLNAAFALGTAVRNGKENVVKFLLEKGVVPGGNLLGDAAWGGYLSILRLLIPPNFGRGGGCGGTLDCVQFRQFLS